MSEQVIVTIERISCLKRSEWKGRKDKIYLKEMGGNQFWPRDGKPFPINPSSPDAHPNCKRYYQFGGSVQSVTIELWEWDAPPGRDDLLGSITINQNSNGRNTAELRGDHGHYHVVYNVDNQALLNRNNPPQNEAAQETADSKEADVSEENHAEVADNNTTDQDSESKTANCKRLIVCCDGTWQSLESPYPTNVVKIALATKPLASDGVSQVVYYHPGIGSSGNILTKEDLINFNIPFTHLNIGLGAGHLEKIIEKTSGGALGKGIDVNIQDAYRFLCMNYQPGDEIYLFGFSRGSYTVRSLSGMLHRVGLLTHKNFHMIPIAYELYRTKNETQDHDELFEFRKKYCYQSKKYGTWVPITLLGCWDTVGSLGVPDVIPFLPGEKLINRDRYTFHDENLSPNVQNGLHAVAIDEPRETFSVTPMMKSTSPEAKEQQVREVWFPGAHGCVGGGTVKQRGLSDGALKWMMDSVGELGLKLEFDEDLLPEDLEGEYIQDYKIKPNPASDYKASHHGLLGTVASKIRGEITRLPGIKPRQVSNNFEDLHESVKKRWKQVSDYRPENLLDKSYRDKLDV